MAVSWIEQSGKRSILMDQAYSESPKGHAQVRFKLMQQWDQGVLQSGEPHLHQFESHLSCTGRLLARPLC
jgi:hypothetical protein